MHLCQTRLSINPQLAGIKHLNRLEQVLARQEWTDSEIAEGLLCDSQGHLIEGISSNLFIQQGERLITPLLDGCGVTGIMRSCVMQAAAELAIPLDEAGFGVDRLLQADAAFVTNSLTGIRLISALPGRVLKPHRVSRKLIKHTLNKMLES
ncbi:MAG: aminotransferase class IV [Gammaproteobacteria bacterium SHHR-1]